MIVFRAQDIRFHLDRHAGQLWRGQERIHLARKEWNVLRYLAENPGKLVSKDELHQIVWRDTHVGPAAIDRAVSDVRQALGDRADDPLFIETVRGRGYRFVAKIESIEDPPSSLGSPPAQTHGLPKMQPVVQTGSSAFRATDKVDIFRVISFDRWPYESSISQWQAAPSGPLPVDCDLVFGTKYRCHSLRPEQFVNWGLVGHNFLDGENFEDANGNHLYSGEVARPEELWIQVEYVLFHSTARADDARINPFRRRITAAGISATAPLGSEAPDRVTVGSFNDPWYQWYQQCDRTEAAECTLFVSAITDLEYVNAQSIPGRQDYDNVQVSICDYRPYPQPPSLTDIFERFDRYNAWFADLSP
jgi:DNA-binding winged helix-turn-helix (wHTH) protein